MYDSNIHFPAWVALVPDTRCFRDNRGCHTYKWPMADDQWFTLAAGVLLLIIIIIIVCVNYYWPQTFFDCAVFFYFQFVVKGVSYHPDIV